MYKIFLFYSVFFLIALIYLKKYEKFTTTAEPKDPGVTTTTKTQIELAEINKNNNILKYNINKTVFSEINENVVKMFVFNEASSKLFLKLDMTLTPKDLSNNYYVSFNLSFNNFSSENKTVIIESRIESRIDSDLISGPEWEIYVLNGRIYYSANNNEKRFNTDINMSTDNKKIHFFSIVHEDNSIKFFLDGEETEEINLNNISKQKIITFAGEGNKDLASLSDFRGYIGNIKYGFRKDETKFDTNDIYQDELICKFIPQHKDEEKCIESCKKSPSCYIGECLYICKGCKNSVQCPWIKTSTQDDYKTTQVWPDPPNPIRTLPGDKRIILEWKKPFEGVHGVIKSYIITVKESYPIDNHGHEQMIYNFKSNNCVNCQYEIQNLKNTVYYDISVKSQNEISDTNQNVQNYLSKDCSETAISAPIGPLNLNDYHPSLIESDETIKDLYDSGIKNTGSSRNNCNDKINLYKNKYNFNSIKNDKEYDTNNETRIKGGNDYIKFYLTE